MRRFGLPPGEILFIFTVSTISFARPCHAHDTDRARGRTDASLERGAVARGQWLSFPADDYREALLDLHRHLVRRPASTFFMHLEGDAHRHAGLHHGDLLVIDRAISRALGRLVAVIDGELSVLFERRQSRLYLAPSQPRLAALPFDPDDARLWGVICYVIHALPAEGEE